jgi:hypothetical protein
MHKVSAVFIFLLISSIAHAGPFGLSMGMHKSDIKEIEKTGNPLTYRTDNVPNPSSKFETYVLQIGESCGLCAIKAVSDIIDTNRYGTKLKRKFDTLHELLSDKYGNNKKQDFLMPGSIWDEPEDFMSGLTKNERYLRAFWDEEENSNLPDNIKSIILSAEGLSREKGAIIIQYRFINSSQCQKELDRMDEEAL